jgi:hypothetical protein
MSAALIGTQKRQTANGKKKKAHGKEQMAKSKR